MQTDTHLYEIFRVHPEWFYDLIGQPPPAGGCLFESITVKQLERRLDGLIRPADRGQAAWIAEFQFWPDGDIYRRVAEEMIAVQRGDPDREVCAAVLFASQKIDPQTMPWATFIRAVYLDEQFRELEGQVPRHPLSIMLAPVFIDSDESLASSGALLYSQLKALPGSQEAKATLDEVFLDLFLQRFKDKSKDEIAMMLEFPDLKETRAGRELYEEGTAFGEVMGEARGVAKGATKAKIDFIVKLISRSFGGEFAGRWAPAIERLDLAGLDQLIDIALDAEDAASVAAWLESRKA